MKYQYKIIDNATEVVLFDSGKENMTPWLTISACKRNGQYQQEDTLIDKTSSVQVYEVEE